MYIFIFILICLFCLISRNIVEPTKTKNADISRPLNQSFRHTGHGSVLGTSWGNPAFIDPAYLGDGTAAGGVELRNAKSPNMRERKKKCVSEQYVRERKSNATKQFAYNKLKNEKHGGGGVVRVEQTNRKSTPPQRPPQPKNINTEKEGMLIDLSPPATFETHTTNGDVDLLATLNGASILDTPIDVPTADCDSSLELSTIGSGDFNKPEPPPYQSPPTYMNTALQQSTMVSASTFTLSDVDTNAGLSRKKVADPFDTSHIGENPIYSNQMVSGATANVNTTVNSNTTRRYGQPYEATTNVNSQLDDLVQNTLLTLSRNNEKKTNNATWYEVGVPTVSALNTTENQTNDSLSDSLKVNLSSLTLNDNDDDFKNSSLHSSTLKTFDKDFLSELEKEIYKNDASASSVIANTSQTYSHQAVKENSVSAIPNECYVRTNTLTRVHNVTATNSPSKVQNVPYPSLDAMKQASPLRPSSSLSLHASVTSTPSKKLNFDSPKVLNSDDASVTAAMNQKWMDAQAQNNVDTTETSQAIYGNSNATQMTYGNIERNHNFVAIANRPLPNQPIASVTTVVANNPSAYSKVPNDRYGSMAGTNVYDLVANSECGSTYYGMTPGTNDYYEPIHPTDTVIYDEVAGEELLRPHRPAPLAPPVLSAQQIQRRMERAQKQTYCHPEAIYNNMTSGGSSAIESNQQKIYALMQEIGGDSDVTEHEAAQALQLVNWDHAAAIRHIKVERLLK